MSKNRRRRQSEPGERRIVVHGQPRSQADLKRLARVVIGLAMQQVDKQKPSDDQEAA